MISWNFSRKRVILLLGLVVPFCLWAGFETLIYGVPERFSPSRQDQPQLVFLFGAVLVSVVDFWVGKLDRTNWRFLLVVAGILCMVLAVLRVHREKKRSRTDNQSGSSGACLEQVERSVNLHAEANLPIREVIPARSAGLRSLPKTDGNEISL